MLQRTVSLVSIVVGIAVSVSVSAFAPAAPLAFADSEPVALKTTTFDTASNYCSLTAAYHAASNTYYLEATPKPGNGCSVSGSVDVYRPLSDGDYARAQTTLYTAAGIQKCQPSKKNRQPCDAKFYDKKTGELLLQDGDSVVRGLRMTVLNRYAFQLSYLMQLQKVDGTVVDLRAHDNDVTLYSVREKECR